jgi:branched-subunit amino acid ABC-type transport system permease component
MRLKFNLQAIPVCLAALVLCAIIGGWYIAFAPPNLAGPDNIGIVLSTFGLSLFLADRLACLWLKVHCRILIFTTWMWGLAFLSWGLLAWLHSFSRQYVSIFIIHWSIFLVIIAVTLLLIRRNRHKAV